MTPPIYIQLGRTGDILNILPMLWKDAQAGTKPRLMVAAEYAPLLEGVSYVEPVVYPGPHFEIAKAVAMAKEQAAGGKIVCLQVNGPKEETFEHTYKPAGLEHAITTSFTKEAWRVAGRLDEWGSFPLVFDRRSSERETALVETHAKGTSRPLLLLALTGNSSPFQYAELLEHLVRKNMEHCRIHVLPKAEQFYDLLGLYERAHCLIAVDSAPLHLARAVPGLPVFALTNDRPMAWNGSAWMPSWAWSCRYSEFPGRAMEMLEFLAGLKTKPYRPFIEVWNAYDKPPRKFAANPSMLPILPGACGRDSASHIKDPQRVPFLKDCLRMALQRAKAKEHICLRRPDTQFQNSPEEVLLKHEACYAYRITDDTRGQSIVPIVDVFCARREWWSAVMAEIPDLLFGTDYLWSQALWLLFKKFGAQDVTGVAYRKGLPPQPKLAGPESPPRVEHNRKLYAETIYRFGDLPRYEPVQKQRTTYGLDTSALPPFAYNPSIARLGGKLLMTYRYHFADDFRTRLGVAELAKGVAVNARDLPIVGHSVEDARLIPYHGELLISWVESNYIGQPNSVAIIKYASLERTFLADEKPAELRLGRVFQPGPHCNTGEHMQKNWAFFESDENLFAVYQAHPEQSVFQIQGEAIVNEYKTKSPTWAYGVVRGGCIVPFGEHLLRFFHSRTDIGLGKLEPRYYVGALVMERRPPFNVLRISTKPIIYGSEHPVYTCPHFKPNVVFPCGAVPSKKHDGWMLAIGVNDAACAVVDITPKDLNLWTL